MGLRIPFVYNVNNPNISNLDTKHEIINPILKAPIFQTQF